MRDFMDYSDHREYKFGLLLIASLAILGLGSWVVQSYFEAAAYRRVTGKEVTTLDAMFLELRIEEPAAD